MRMGRMPQEEQKGAITEEKDDGKGRHSSGFVYFGLFMLTGLLVY